MDQYYSDRFRCISLYLLCLLGWVLHFSPEILSRSLSVLWLRTSTSFSAHVWMSVWTYPGKFWLCSCLVFLWWVWWGQKRLFVNSSGFLSSSGPRSAPTECRARSPPAAPGRAKAEESCAAWLEKASFHPFYRGLCQSPVAVLYLWETSSTCLKGAKGTESPAFLVKFLKQLLFCYCWKLMLHKLVWIWLASASKHCILLHLFLLD